MAQYKSIMFIAVIGLIVFFSGCVSNQETSKTNEQVFPTSTASPTSTVLPASTQMAQSAEQNKINELENKINSMQQQIKDLETRLDAMGLLKPSNKNLIPNVPFRIEVKTSEWQTPITYTFKETGEVEIREAGFVDLAAYRLFSNNNTIKIISKKYDYYGIVLYDDYAAAIFENGWMEWVRRYQIFPPKFNTITQKYELE